MHVLLSTAILTQPSCVTKTDELLTYIVNANRTSWTYGRDDLSLVAEITGARPENQIRKTKSLSNATTPHQLYSGPQRVVQTTRHTDVHKYSVFYTRNYSYEVGFSLVEVTDEFASNSSLHKGPINVTAFAA
jgi:hypothetical protein